MVALCLFTTAIMACAAPTPTPTPTPTPSENTDYNAPSQETNTPTKPAIASLFHNAFPNTGAPTPTPTKAETPHRPTSPFTTTTPFPTDAPSILPPPSPLSPSSPTATPASPSSTPPPPTDQPNTFPTKAPETPSPTAGQSDDPQPIHYWILDGLTSAEERTVKALTALARNDVPLSERVYGMPFLEHHHNHDHTALDSLAAIAYFDPDFARRLLDHPDLQPGITDQTADAVSLAYAHYLFDDQQQPQLPAPVHYSPFAVQLANSQEITFTVVATAQQADTTSLVASRTKAALSWLYQYLGTPPFNRHFVIHIDGPLPPEAVGANVGPSISIRSSSLDRLEHEIVHNWFINNQPWLNEGIAQLLPALMRHQQMPTAMPVPTTRCPPNARLSDFNEAADDIVQPYCLYDLGLLVLTEIYNATGPEAFQKAFQIITTRQQARWIPAKLGIDHLVEAFPNHQQQIQEIVRLRY